MSFSSLSLIHEDCETELNRLFSSGLVCPVGQEYHVCGSSCGLTCLDRSLVEAGKCEDKCVDGCQCARDMALDSNGNCVPSAKKII